MEPGRLPSRQLNTQITGRNYQPPSKGLKEIKRGLQEFLLENNINHIMGPHLII